MESSDFENWHFLATMFHLFMIFLEKDKL